MGKYDDASYDVGKGKPPKHTQWKKGTSPNPSGRPKGVRNFQSDLDDELNELITITENGDLKKITKQRALIKQMVNAAMKGDYKHSNALVSLITKPSEGKERSTKEQKLSNEDQAIINRFLETYGVGPNTRNRSK